MSLALLEGYSSAEEEDGPAAGAGAELSESADSSAEEAGSDGDEGSAPPKSAFKPRRRPNRKKGDAGGGDGDSCLPSALEAFSDVSGPPEFLRHRVAEPEEGTEALGVLDRRGKEGSKQPPPGK
jgi:hypothetical protein